MKDELLTSFRSGGEPHDYKFWPHVSRVDNVFGDRNPGLLVRGDGELFLTTDEHGFNSAAKEHKERKTFLLRIGWGVAKPDEVCLGEWGDLRLAM